MKKVLLIVAIIVIIIIGVVYFYESGKERMMIGEELGEPYVVGEIYEIGSSGVMIAEGFNEDDEMGIGYFGTAIWFTIDEETKIMNSEGKFISFEDLEIGMRVRAWATGAILESYPEQGTALVIMLEEVKESDETVGDIDTTEDEDKEEDIALDDDIDVDKDDEIEIACYVGGCSGELCTDDPEIMGTCELLPGMECIPMEMRCEAVDGECTWIMSKRAAECFIEVEKKEGVGVRDTRIGYLFDKAEDFLK